MKKSVGLLLIIIFIGVISFTGCGPSSPGSNPTPALSPTPSPTPGPTPVPGRNIVHYDGDPSTSMGIGPTTECLVYFNATKLQSYIGCNLTGVQIFYANDGNSLSTVPYTVKVYNGVGGTNTSPGTLLYSQTYTFTEGDWNEVTLDTPIPITPGLVIWAGFYADWNSPYGIWPISYDNLAAVPKTSYIKNTVQTTWGEITVNLNIRLAIWKD